MQFVNELTLLPPHIAAQSISKTEIVLPLNLALDAIDILESAGVHILGWEGWIKTADGRIGHGNAPQGSISLEALTTQAAARFCKETINESYCLWTQENPNSANELYFCISIKC